MELNQPKTTQVKEKIMSLDGKTLIDRKSVYALDVALTGGSADTFGVLDTSEGGVQQSFSVRLRGGTGGVSAAITLNLEHSDTEGGAYTVVDSYTTAGALAEGAEVIPFALKPDIKRFTRVSKVSSASTGKVTIFPHYEAR
jgi:hypothetical protein